MSRLLITFTVLVAVGAMLGWAVALSLPLLWLGIR
jgi:hypothetical protein